MERISVDIFKYKDFRKYIKDYYDVNSRADSRFSYQFLADRGGFDNRVLVYRIIEGKSRRLSAENCIRLSKALNHTPEEAEYFSCLFDLDQIINAEKRLSIETRMRDLTDRQNVRIKMIRKDRDHEAYYAELYHSVIRALVEINSPFRDEFEKLCQQSLLPVSEAQAKESLELLERIAFIEKDEDGIYRIRTEENIKTSREYTQHYKDTLNMKYSDAVRTLIKNHTPSTPKIFRSKVVGISEQTYHEICRMAEEFSKRVDTLVQNEKTSDRVYFYQLSFVPLTKLDPAQVDN